MLTILGWLAALALTVLAALTAVQAAYRHDEPLARSSAVAALGTGCAAICAITTLGAIPAFAGLLLSVLAAFGALGLIWRDKQCEPWDAVMAAKIALIIAVRGLWLRPGSPVPAPAAAGGQPPAAARVIAARPAARAVPPARMDPALDPDPPGPDVASAMVIAPWAALASFVAGFEPENAGEFLAFFRDQARGLLAFAEAMRTCAENCGEAGAGADPAVVQAVTEFGDAVGDGAHDGELVRRRLLVVYGEQLRAVADGLVMPFDARKFLGDAGEAA